MAKNAPKGGFKHAEMAQNTPAKTGRPVDAAQKLKKMQGIASIEIFVWPSPL
jgi:hypothetical protein